MGFSRARKERAMIIIKPRQLPDSPDYKTACQHTITAYNVYKIGTATHYHKTIINSAAFMDFKRQWQEATTGTTANNPALIVIPQGADGKTFVDSIAFDELDSRDGFFTLRDNDKVYYGVGPDITTSTEWSNFIPTKVHGVVTVKSVDIKKNLAGDVVHIEAGG